MLEEWHDFYLLMAGAAGSLIGLLFVVVSLTTGSTNLEQTEQGRRLYTSPVVAQLAVILGTGCLAMVPRLDTGVAAPIVGAAGLGGAAYMGWSAWVFWFTDYKPAHWTDAWCYAVIPAGCYAGMAGAGLVMALKPAWGLMLLALSQGALLITSVRNAWDLITWIAPRARPGAGK